MSLGWLGGQEEGDEGPVPDEVGKGTEPEPSVWLELQAHERDGLRVTKLRLRATPWLVLAGEKRGLQTLVHMSPSETQYGEGPHNKLLNNRNATNKNPGWQVWPGPDPTETSSPAWYPSFCPETGGCGHRR